MEREIFKLYSGKGGYVTAQLLIPENTKTRKGLVLAHGLGNDLNHPLLETFAIGLAKKGMVTAFQLPLQGER